MDYLAYHLIQGLNSPDITKNFVFLGSQQPLTSESIC